MQKKTSLARKSLLNPSTKPHTQDVLIKVKQSNTSSFYLLTIAHDCSRLLMIAHDCSRLLTIAHDCSRLLTIAQLGDYEFAESLRAITCNHVCPTLSGHQPSMSKQWSKQCFVSVQIAYREHLTKFILRFWHNHMPIVSGDVFLPMEKTCASGCLTLTCPLLH